MRGPLAWIGLAVVAAGATILVFADMFVGISNVRGTQIVSLITGLALLVVIGAGALGSYRGRSTMLLQHTAIWLGIIAVISLVYTYRSVLGFNWY